MSDHIDGPRQTADPVSDLTDLFAFTSPADPKRTVLIACVLPFAGESALFSNTINYALVVRRLKADRKFKHGPGPPRTHLTMVQGPIVAVNPAAEPPSGTAFSTLSWPAQRPLPARIISRSSSAAPSAPLSL